jgi:hypothetical protein
LQEGEIGDNLMYRYRALASFYLWDEICAAAMNATRQLLADRSVDAQIDHFDEFWDDFTTYVRLSHACGGDRASILASRDVHLHYDFAGWLRQDNLSDATQFRLPERRCFEFRLTPVGRDELDRALQVWTTHIKGLSKLVTRIKVDSQVRECVPIGWSEGLKMSAGAGMA